MSFSLSKSSPSQAIQGCLFTNSVELAQIQQKYTILEKNRGSVKAEELTGLLDRCQKIIDNVPKVVIPENLENRAKYIQQRDALLEKTTLLQQKLISLSPLPPVPAKPQLPPPVIIFHGDEMNPPNYPPPLPPSVDSTPLSFPTKDRPKMAPGRRLPTRKPTFAKDAESTAASSAIAQATNSDSSAARPPKHGVPLMANGMLGELNAKFLKRKEATDKAPAPTPSIEENVQTVAIVTVKKEEPEHINTLRQVLEAVNGNDPASLKRRVGRLPEGIAKKIFGQVWTLEGEKLVKEGKQKAHPSFGKVAFLGEGRNVSKETKIAAVQTILDSELAAL